MRKRVLLQMLSLVLFVGILALPVRAQTGTFEFNGLAHLNAGFPCAPYCPGTFDGMARGVTVLPTINCATGCPMTAQFAYNEVGSCMSGIPLATIGTARGIYVIESSFSGEFSWTRVGVTAVITLTQPFGAAVAGFVPPRRCNGPNAGVVGVALVV